MFFAISQQVFLPPMIKRNIHVKNDIFMVSKGLVSTYAYQAYTERTRCNLK